MLRFLGLPASRFGSEQSDVTAFETHGRTDLRAREKIRGKLRQNLLAAPRVSVELRALVELVRATCWTAFHLVLL